MKVAALFEKKTPLRILETEMPNYAEDEVLIKVSACGVCHSDLKVMHGELPYDKPSVLGHEISGVIESVGSRCKMGFKQGDKVIVGLRYKCGVCSYCMTGRENLCMNMPSPSDLRANDGSAVHRWILGGFAQHLAVPEYTVVRLPDGLPVPESSLLGCRVTTAYNAIINAADFKMGESALVIGCGGVGLNLIQLLSLFGGYPIIGVDLVPSRLEAAKKFGATHTIDASKVSSVVESVKAITGLGVDKSFEAIGLAKTSDQAVQSVRPGGTAVWVGAPTGQLLLSDAGFAFNEVKIAGVRRRRRADLEQVLALAARGKINPKELVTNSYRLEEINEAYEDLEKRRIGTMGIITMD